MNKFTIDTYFDVLTECTLEAFESLKLKDFFPKDGTKPIWYVGNLTIESNNNANNNLIKNEYIKDSLKTTFINALERNWKTKFFKKYSIERPFFYQKCYEALVYKLTQSNLFNKPDFGFDLENPNVLSFLWYNRIYLDQKVNEVKSVQNNANLYKNSIPVFFVENCLNKLNEDKTQNKSYYNKIINDSNNEIIDQINTIESFEIYRNKAVEYIEAERLLKLEIIKFLVGCKDEKISQIQYHYHEIENQLNRIKDFTRAIDHYKNIDENYKALKLKNFIISKLRLIIKDFQQLFGINIKGLPIDNKINDLITHFENSINVDELEKIEALKPINFNDEKNDLTKKEPYLGQSTNENANHFFDFLIEYYRPDENTQVKFVNIHEFLKKDANKDLFVFKLKQEDFKKLIKIKLGIKISKFQKSLKYIEEEKPILKHLERTFIKK